MAFAFILSDAAFGTLPARMSTEVVFSEVRPGDILRMENDTHSVIVLETHEDYVVIAEGSYNNSVHWDRVLSAAQVEGSDNIMTRYPEDAGSGSGTTSPIPDADIAASGNCGTAVALPPTEPMPTEPAPTFPDETVPTQPETSVPETSVPTVTVPEASTSTQTSVPQETQTQPSAPTGQNTVPQQTVLPDTPQQPEDPTPDVSRRIIIVLGALAAALAAVVVLLIVRNKKKTHP